MRPIAGQPGLYRRSETLAGLGDLTSLRAALGAVQASYDRTKTLATSLIREYPALGTSSILELARSVSILAAEGLPNLYARMGTAEYAGVVRLGLAAATGNIARARALINALPEVGSGALDAARFVERQAMIQLLLGKAAATISSINALAAALKSAQEAVAEGIRVVELRTGRTGLGRSGLGVIGWDDVALAAVVIVAVVLVYTLLSSVQASYSANSAADSACERDAAAGHPCTGTQWSTYRDAAAASASTFSLVPNMGHALEQAGQGVSSALFWGALLAVGGALAYGAWTAAPAAMITRERLRARAAATLTGVRARRRRR